MQASSKDFFVKVSFVNKYSPEGQAIKYSRYKKWLLKDMNFKQDKEKIKIPKFVQDIIPVKAIYEDGIFLVGKNKYSCHPRHQ